MPEINSWEELAALANTKATGGWIFRGEARTGNKVLPKAGRFGTHRGDPRQVPYELEDEQRALKHFKRAAHPFLDRAPDDDLEWLAIAQHHGMSTRLLDWTDNLFVAAYFAVAEMGSKGDAAIHGVRGLPVADDAAKERPFDVAEVCIYHPRHISARVPAQRSVFTVHPTPTEPFVHPELVQWQIAKGACESIKGVLDAVSINEASLFPGIDGVARHVAWRYKWGKLDDAGDMVQLAGES